jgi:RNA polymerase sigma factor (sigma-70 family)
LPLFLKMRCHCPSTFFLCNELPFIHPGCNIFLAHPFTQIENIIDTEARSGMAGPEWTITEQDRFLAETIEKAEPRLRGFIGRRVFDTGDAEDILHDVFYELIQTYRLMKPVEQVTAWMYRVARNRITDMFRRQRPTSLNEPVMLEHGAAELIDLLPSEDAGPDALYSRRVMLEAIEEALAELPVEQRIIFIAHELEGRSFKDISEESGVGVNTLLSRKRYAVLHLRSRLEEIYTGFGEDRG